MKLYELLTQLEYQLLNGTNEIEIEAPVDDSGKVRPGSLFVCIRGVVSDGHDYIGEAIDRGAAAVAAALPVSEAYQEMCEAAGVTLIGVADTRYALASIAAVYYDFPADKLKVIGITGTKGKTTITYMIKAILEEAGHKVGLIGTIEVLIGKTTISADNTTPESLLIQKYLNDMVDSGCDFAIMEVSSQGLKMHRTSGIRFKAGVFTNLGKDHIGPMEHADLEEYAYCKSLLFRQCDVGIGNIDDSGYDKVCGQAACRMITFGCGSRGDLRADRIHLIRQQGYLGVSYRMKGKESFPVTVYIPGSFSVYNSLAAAAVCREFEVPAQSIQKALQMVSVKGRIEMLDVSQYFTVMIDYAHNAMSLKSILSTLREYGPNRLIVLFGCGGNRAKARRYEMGETAGQLADFTIITSDNPRWESPREIMDDIENGMKKTAGRYIMIEDRKEAMRYAIRYAQPNDIVVFAGKGHETYQDVRGKKHDMDERKLVAEILEEGAD